MKVRWFTSRYPMLFWHWGTSFADHCNGSAHYWRAICGANAGADPYLFRGDHPPRWVEVDRGSKGTASQSRRRCPECVAAIKHGRRPSRAAWGWKVTA